MELVLLVLTAPFWPALFAAGFGLAAAALHRRRRRPEARPKVQPARAPAEADLFDTAAAARVAAAKAAPREERFTPVGPLPAGRNSRR